ncbi:sigma-54-dependent transcriptional regulator [Candidatus Poribacteria bacterium]
MEGSLKILLVDDEEIVHQTISGYLRDSGHQVDDVYDGLAALESIKAEDYDVAFVDIRMPGMDGLSLLGGIREIRPDISVVMVTGNADMDTVIQALRLDADDFLLKPVELLRLDAVLEKSARINALRQDRRRLRETISGIQASEDFRRRNRSFVGKSAATRDVREHIHQAVDADCETILVTGETGTGKEVVAREIHFQASSDECPFIAVSCPALPESLVESELFGHTKGAFTGATADRAGSFEMANGGTLFLDEIADLSAPAQAKLLRVLETRMVRRVGSSREINVNVRVISATNTPLEQLVEARKFRPDLFYRLNVYSIHILPLRERREDILPLAEHFLSMYATPRGLSLSGFSSEANNLLLNYDFPGNARELRNIVERAAILCRSGQILVEHLNLPSDTAEVIPAQATGDQERSYILKALEEAKWNRRQTASNLGMPYSTLRYKMQKLGIA